MNTGINPLTRLLTYLSHLFKPTISSQKQLVDVLKQASKTNVLETDISTMIESVIHFSTLRVRDIMIPRAQMITVPEDTSLDDLFELAREHGHSRYPVIGESKDEIVGILHTKDLLTFKSEQDDFDLHEIVRPHAIIPESKCLSDLLRDFRKNRNHMAIVVDEYGGVSGFVTIEDVLEQIVGDIEDEFDSDDHLFIKVHKDGAYIVKGEIPIDEFNQYFCTNFNHKGYETLSVLLQKQKPDMPSIGDEVIIDKVGFKILNADSRRIKLVEFKHKVNEA